MEMAQVSLKGKKLNMSQFFTNDGKVVPVTFLSIEEAVDETLTGQPIVLTGQSKGKGFTGGMKKWNFAGQQATRGQSDKPRAPGSIGAQTPSRVFKGKKMAGRHGNKRVTIKSSKFMEINNEQKRVAVLGPVPGARNSIVTIQFEKEDVSNEN